LAAAGGRVAAPLRAFLLGLAIVDDVGAIVIIAAVYSTGVAFGWLAAAAAAVAVTLLVRRFGVHTTWVYVVIGCTLWFGLHEAGVHPTIAGVAMGLIAPCSPRLHRDLIDDSELTNLSDVGAARETVNTARDSVSVVEWLLHVLHPWTSFVIVPIFALANSGIELSIDGFEDALGSPVTWGVFVGLVAGKPLGIVLATRAAIASGTVDRPDDATTGQLIGVGTAAGIGFTVALFITELAFEDAADQADAKLAILLASVVSAALAITFLTTPLSRRSPRAT
jgi:NhaA family Na+:H+ antiporter